MFNKRVPNRCTKQQDKSTLFYIHKHTKDVWKKSKKKRRKKERNQWESERPSLFMPENYPITYPIKRWTPSSCPEACLWLRLIRLPAGYYGGCYALSENWAHAFAAKLGAASAFSSLEHQLLLRLARCLGIFILFVFLLLFFVYFFS